MPVAEITAGITSIRAAHDLTKAYQSDLSSPRENPRSGVRRQVTVHSRKRYRRSRSQNHYHRSDKRRMVCPLRPRTPWRNEQRRSSRYELPPLHSILIAA
jgi:hypothetical protein